MALRWRNVMVLLCMALACLVFVLAALIRDEGLGGPHHDEVIALQAAKGTQPAYTRLREEGASPFGTVVAASVWQEMAAGLSPQSFATVRDGMLQGDIHPPLAFWLMGHWAGLTGESGYSGQVALSILWVLLGSAVLAWILVRDGADARTLLLCLLLLLFSNAALTTAAWIRQYGLSSLWFLLTVMLALEAARQWRPSLVVLLPLAALGGMLTHFEYLTMTACLHMTVLVMAWRGGGFRRGVALLVGYAGALGSFLLLMPDAIQVYLLGDGLKTQHAGTLLSSVGSVGQAWLPVPSKTPVALAFLFGSLALLLPFLLLAVQWVAGGQEGQPRERQRLWVLAAAALGCGLIQTVLAAGGVFPVMATQPYHMLPLLCVTLLGLGGLLHSAAPGPQRWLRRAASGVVIGMLALQAAYLQNLQSLSARYHTYYAATGHDLVIIDNLSRGFVLSVAAVLRPDQPVLVAPARQIATLLQDGGLDNYPRIAYLPMDETVREGKPAVLAAAAQAGRKVEEYPVVFTGLYEAIGLHAQP